MSLARSVLVGVYIYIGWAKKNVPNFDLRLITKRMLEIDKI